MKHFTNKKTNEVFGYESIEDAKKYNDDYENLIEMTNKQFIDFRDSRPKGGRWTIDGWVVDEVLLKEELDKEDTVALEDIKTEIVSLTVRIQEHIIMGETDEARELILRKRELEEIVEDKELDESL